MELLWADVGVTAPALAPSLAPAEMGNTQGMPQQCSDRCGKGTGGQGRYSFFTVGNLCAV